MQEHFDILFIEDNPHEAELTLWTLKKLHLASRINHIDDGAEALDFIFGKPTRVKNEDAIIPGLILLDLKLPKIDGLEILRKIKLDETTKMIPVVVLTSSKEEKGVIESYKLGVNSYIVKPVNFESFGRTVAELGLYWMILNQNANS